VLVQLAQFDDISHVVLHDIEPLLDAAL